MKFRRLCVLFCLSSVMLACGQKGPLVLPDAPKHKRLAPKPAAAPPTESPTHPLSPSPQ